jgi:hypothetical protein
MSKKQKGMPKEIKLSKKELFDLLEDAHEMGYNTGLHTRAHYENEQEEDCEFVFNEYFDICNN